MSSSLHGFHKEAAFSENSSLMRLLGCTRKEGRRLMDGLCCIKLNNKTTPIDDNSKRRKKQANDQKKNMAPTSEEKKKNKLGKMKLKSCWKKKEHKEQKRGISSLASLVNTMSFKSDDGRHKLAAEEILRRGSDKIAATVFTFRELAAATRNFNSENLLGEGGFGRVYRGQLKGSNEIVAVKQLDRNGFQGSREFLVEVLMLSLLHHQNLVKLLGYCAEGDQRILVYEYMPLGSLEDHLLDLAPDAKPLDWHTRMKIAAGAAKGLEYLHEIANPPVIYRDFKPSNILVDEEYNAKLSDFGLAKLGPVGDKTHVSTRVMGTYGYCAPEYALTGQLTKMSDVYSFGVVFLELITGRRAIDTSKPTREQHLVHWAEPLFKDKRKFVAMADPCLEGKYPVKGLYQALAVAAMCLQEEATIRPLISDVVTALEYLANPRNATAAAAAVDEESIPASLHPSPSSETTRDDNSEPEVVVETNSTSYQGGSSFSSREDDLHELVPN